MIKFPILSYIRGGTTFYYLNDLAYSWNGTLGDRYVSEKLTEHGKAELSNNCSTIELYYHSYTDSTLAQLWDFCGQEIMQNQVRLSEWEERAN